MSNYSSSRYIPEGRSCRVRFGQTDSKTSVLCQAKLLQHHRDISAAHVIIDDCDKEAQRLGIHGMKTLVPYERINQSSNTLCPPSPPVSTSRRAASLALVNIVSAPVCKLSAAVSNVERIAPQFFSMASLAPPGLSNENLSLASWNSIGSSIGYLSNKLSRLSSFVTGSTDCHPESPKAPPEDESCSFTDDNEDDDSHFCYVDYESEFEIQESDDESVGSMNSLSDFDPSSLLSTPHSYEDAHFGYEIGQAVLVIVGSEWCEGEIISLNSDGNYGVRLFGENFVRNVWASFVREI